LTKVAVLDDYQQRAHEYADWDSLGPDVDVAFFAEPIGQDVLAQTLAEFDVLVLMRERTAFPRAVLERLPRLKLVVTTGNRNAAVDNIYLAEAGVLFCGTGRPGAATAVSPVAPGIPSTAEVGWALILAACKRVTAEDRALRAGRWQLGLPVNLAGATLGLAGLGHLGSAMVGPARAFGMNVIAWSQNLTDERAAEVGVRRVTKALRHRAAPARPRTDHAGQRRPAAAPRLRQRARLPPHV
jgi:phosphoglycerate dehydrogenase-like enzyme